MTSAIPTWMLHSRAEDYGRQPPQDMAAEQSVLGGMMLSKDAIADVLERLRPGDFYRPAHQSVYDAILDLYGRGEPADAITVSAELDRRGLLKRVGGAPYLHTLISTVPTAANAGLLRGHRRREVTAAAPRGGRHAHRAVRVRRRRGCRRRRRWSTGRRPRSTRSPTAARRRTSFPSSSCCSPPWTRSTPSRRRVASRAVCRRVSSSSTR